MRCETSISTIHRKVEIALNCAIYRHENTHGTLRVTTTTATTTTTTMMTTMCAHWRLPVRPPVLQHSVAVCLRLARPLVDLQTQNTALASLAYVCVTKLMYGVRLTCPLTVITRYPPSCVALTARPLDFTNRTSAGLSQHFGRDFLSFTW